MTVRQQFEYHPRIGFRFIPGLRARIPHESGGYLVEANATGFRCRHEFTSGKHPGVRRVLLFGDSFTAGDGVRNEARFGDLLERLIPDLEVYNFGLPGTGTDQQYLCFREYAAEIEHDLLVVALQVENIRRIAARFRPYLDDAGRERLFAKPYFEADRTGALQLRQVPVPREPLDLSSLAAGERQHVDQGGRFRALREIVRAVGLKDVVQRLSSFQPLPEYDDPANPVWLLMCAILEDWRVACRARMLLVPLPLYHHVEELADPGPYQARFRELAARLGCALHDPLPDLRAHAPTERRAFRFATDIHPTPAGHEALSRSLLPTIARELALVAA